MLLLYCSSARSLLFLSFKASSMLLRRVSGDSGIGWFLGGSYKVGDGRIDKRGILRGDGRRKGFIIRGGNG